MIPLSRCRLNSLKWRSFSTSNADGPTGSSVTPLPPLSEAMPNLTPVTYTSAKSEDYFTEITTLSNGLRVASEKKFGQFCTAGGNFTTVS